MRLLLKLAAPRSIFGSSRCDALHINDNPGPEIDALHTKTQTQDAQAQTVEKGIDRNDSQKSALGPRANAMTASSVGEL